MISKINKFCLRKLTIVTLQITQMVQNCQKREKHL